MKTTIVVEDDGSATSGAQTAAAVHGDSLDARSAPVDAGAAPTGSAGQPAAGVSANGASDGGMPPPWLVEAIAEAGGMTGPSSPGNTGLTAADAGAAPA
jgi:hypothetical protein